MVGCEDYPRSIMLESFRTRAALETDPKLVSDLSFTGDIAEAFQSLGGLALVVGGYARDAAIAQLTGQKLESKDIDIEVYGVEFDEMARRLETFGQVDLVGSSFGIVKVRNPESGNVLDFSIPRADSKVDKGHKGFVVSGDPNMSVREAARRRDLTMNALAVNPLTGEVIDEYGGLDDIRAGILRATDMELFADDPLRVLRVMQFAGRFGFSVDSATAELCQALDLSELSKERIGEEWIKLMTKSAQPSVGLEVGRQLGVLEKLHPELAALDKTPQDPGWHPEGNVWNHTLLAVDAAARVVRQEDLTSDEALVVLFGALCHDLGKATTTQWREKDGRQRITAYGHETASVEPSKTFLDSIKMKGDVTKAILPIVREHLYHINNPQPTDKALARFAERLLPANIRLWYLVSCSDSNGRGRKFALPTPSYEIYQKALALNIAEQPAAPIVQGRDLIELGLKPGPAFGPILRQLYDAQLGGEFRDVEDGITYYREHIGQVQE